MFHYPLAHSFKDSTVHDETLRGRAICLFAALCAVCVRSILLIG